MQVYTGKEHRVAECCRQVITREHEELFIPLCKRQKKFHGKLETITSVLYPGYLFCETEEPNRLFLEVKGIQEMTKLLRMEEDILPVDKHEAEHLYRLFGDEHVVEMSKGYMEGDRVKILSGPLIYFEGQIRKVDRHKRLAVLELELMGRTVRTTVGLEIIEKS